MRRFLAACALVCALALYACVPAGAASLHALVDQAAASAGVPRAIAHAVIRQESNYQPHLRGSAGEWGMGQIKCQTARGVGFVGPCGALADPAVNLQVSMRDRRQALDRGGAGCAGVSLYQSGLYGPRRCSPYGRAVMARVGPWLSRTIHQG